MTASITRSLEHFMIPATPSNLTTYCINQVQALWPTRIKVIYVFMCGNSKQKAQSISQNIAVAHKNVNSCDENSGSKANTTWRMLNSANLA